jgi:FkbM family methyltransferase
MRNLFRKVVNKIILPHSQLVYAHSGEDLILAHLFYKLNIERPSYLDIGANHPAFISNTYYFYLRGSRGVCVEPNPFLAKKIRQLRNKDIVINAGVGIGEATEADFYLFPDDAHGLSTFVKEEAEYWQTTGMKRRGKIAYEKVIKMSLVTINSLMEKYFKAGPDFISLDVEGYDLGILQSLNFELYAPKVICVETISYDKDQREIKNAEIIQFLQGKGFQIYADTHVNTIFLNNKVHA